MLPVVPCWTAGWDNCEELNWGWEKLVVEECKVLGGNAAVVDEDWWAWCGWADEEPRPRLGSNVVLGGG